MPPLPRTGHAIVRPPGPNFADGLTTVDLGVPDLARALAQHAAYCEALGRCGVQLTRLPADPRHPDSAFVEDTAVLTANRAILTRPGAPSRAGEVESIRSVLSERDAEIVAISAPGTLDGGDVCEADGHFFIGVSRRTNEDGARQLAAFLAEEGFTTSTIDIRAVEGILHLKSGLASPGDGRLIAIEPLALVPELRKHEVIRVDAEETYAANCIRVNDRLLIAAGYPRLEAKLRGCGYPVCPLEMSEFEKMDGGLSCLSLRF
jgi:dimethylargininase